MLAWRTLPNGGWVSSAGVGGSEGGGGRGALSHTDWERNVRLPAGGPTTTLLARQPSSGGRGAHVSGGGAGGWSLRPAVTAFHASPPLPSAGVGDGSDLSAARQEATLTCLSGGGEVGRGSPRAAPLTTGGATAAAGPRHREGGGGCWLAMGRSAGEGSIPSAVV